MATLKILQDTDPLSPREMDNLGQMICWHRRYNLGDVQPKESPDEWRKENVPEGSVELPLYLYDHSGITMNTGGFSHCDSARWDWGQVGFIFCPPDKIKKEYSVEVITPEIVGKVEGVLRREVKTYDQFLRGDVWGFQYEEEGKEDSCWGFFGDSLDETGILGHLPATLDKGLAEQAWEHRQ
jgi:hypothetical protein